MITQEPAITVQEVSMQEWAMVAFHAERAPKRSRGTVRATAVMPDIDHAARGARAGLWVVLASAMIGMAWWLI